MKSNFGIAAVALLAAVAIVPAHAAEKTVNGGIPGKTYPAKIQPQASGAAVTYNAVVSSAGALIRGHAASVTYVGTGTYIVYFHENVSKCSFVGDVGTTGSSGVVPAGYVTVAGAAAGVKGVFVQTYDDTATLTDSSFHLIVAC
jgi:hypothetical protein